MRAPAGPARIRRRSTDHRPRAPLLPGPAIAEPQRRQHVQLVRLGSGIADAKTQTKVARRGLGVVGGDLPVAVVVEDAGVEQLELALLPGASRALLAQPLIRKFRLRVVIAPAQPRGGRRGVEVPPVFLGVLAVIALAVAQAEDALFQERVATVPERQRETQPLIDVADAGESVLVPAVGARAGMIVREVVPGIALGAVVLAHRAPRPFAQVGAERLPVTRQTCGCFRESRMLRTFVFWHLGQTPDGHGIHGTHGKINKLFPSIS